MDVSNPSVNGKYRDWCFTWYTAASEETVLLSAMKPTVHKYLVFQQEKCPTTGRLHWQGYLEFKTPHAMPKRLYTGAHWEARRGSQDQARNYCMEEDTRVKGPWEWGNFVRSEPGKRTDLVAIYDAIKEGKTKEEVIELNPGAYIRYHGGIDKLFLQQKTMKPVPRVVWLWGLSGTGKSRRAKQNANCEDDVLIEGKDYAFSNPPPRIFQEYNTTIPRFIFDDYNPKDVPHRALKRYLDRNPVTVNIMYGSVQFVPQEIIITCSRAPAHIWSGNELTEIERRCTEITEVTE